MTDAERIDQACVLVRVARAVIFDFDGPLCDVFAGMPAWEVARNLEALLGERTDTDDPLEILRRAGTSSENILASVEYALVDAEVQAVRCSTRTPGGVESVRACLDGGRLVGVVSNNSASAIAEFFMGDDLAERIWPIVGREPLRPDLMKPNPWPLIGALNQLQVAPRDALFVGDTSTDLEVAKVVGVPCIAFANKPGKREFFEAAGADLTVDSMRDLEAGIRRA